MIIAPFIIVALIIVFAAIAKRIEEDRMTWWIWGTLALIMIAAFVIVLWEIK